METKKIKKKIDELIQICPSNWAELASAKLNITPDAVHKRKNNVKNISLLIEMILVLKEISEDYKKTITEAFSR